MSPRGGPDSGGPSHHPLARLGGSSASALSELLLFHPIDTAAKRLMTHEGRLLTAEGLSFSGKIGKMRAVVFRDQLQASPAQKFRSLFPGIKFGASYKLCQRTAAYGTQPFVFDYVHKHYHDDFARVAGSKRAKNLAFASAAAITGTMEIVFLPLDTLKIVAQTNPASLQGRTFLQIVQQEKFRLYRAAGWTALRNFPGSFCLFGGSALVKEKVFHLENYKDASLFQELVASTTGAIWSLTISSPADVIKARVQRGSLALGQVQVNGRDILRELLKKEGPWALFKGLNSKFLVVAPKLVMSFTVYNQVMSWADRLLDPQESSSSINSSGSSSSRRPPQPPPQPPKRD